MPFENPCASKRDRNPAAAFIVRDRGMSHHPSYFPVAETMKSIAGSYRLLRTS